MKVDIKFTVPSKLCSSCLSFGAASAVMPLTFFGHGWTPCGVMIRPKCRFHIFWRLTKHLREGLCFIALPSLFYKMKTLSVSGLLASDKAFEGGSLFYSFTQPFLQNEDPVSFACDSIQQSTLGRL